MATQEEYINKWFGLANDIKNGEALNSLISEMATDIKGIEDKSLEPLLHMQSLVVMLVAIANMNTVGATEIERYVIGALFARHYVFQDVDTGVSIRNYDDMLDPEAQGIFEKRVSKDVFSKLQTAAKTRLDLMNSMEGDADEEIESLKRHLQSIIDGQAPFGYKVV